MPVSIQMPETDLVIQATTKDVSASGVFFYTSFELKKGSNIEFIMTLPPELTHTAGIQVACKGTILRIERDITGDRVGVGAAIHCFDILAATVSAASNL
jgi:hypothetical protein